MGKHVRAGGLDIWTQQVGAGPDVLLIGGLGDTVESWQFQLDRYRVTAFDNRGAGRTAMSEGRLSAEAMADDAAALMRALELPTAHVAGFSMGSAIAQEHHRSPGGDRGAHPGDGRGVRHHPAATLRARRRQGDPRRRVRSVPERPTSPSRRCRTSGTRASTPSGAKSRLRADGPTSSSSGSWAQLLARAEPFRAWKQERTWAVGGRL